MNPLSSVRLTPRGAQLVRAGHPFLAPSDLVTEEGAEQGGDVVRMLDARGAFLGTALFAPRSRIALRVLSRKEEDLDRALLRERIARAAARRAALFGDEVRSHRVVHGEADQLPGLFIDRYGLHGEAAVIQTAALAMDQREQQIAEVVAEVLGVSLVVARDDGSARDLDGLPRRKGVLISPGQAQGRGQGQEPAQDQAQIQGQAQVQAIIRFRDAGTLMETDLLSDGKTGAFLDQQENHACAYDYARRLFSEPGRAGATGPAAPAMALDAFTYHGGFALALARAGLSVLACDENPQAVQRARRNAELNGLSVDFRVHNAFDLLRTLEAEQRRFAIVVIDPPALLKRGQAKGGSQTHDGQAKAAANQRAAIRAYKELNLRGLRLLAQGGLLITCSCSGRLSPWAFGEMLEEAARDVGRSVQVLERRGAGRDHPVLLGVPETEYLKCWVLQVS